MNDHDDIDRTLGAAFTARANSVSSPIPQFDDIETRSHQRTRRTLAAATLGLVAVGALGVLTVATSGPNDPYDSAAGDALPIPSDGQFVAPTSTAYATTWACSGPLGSSDDGMITYFQSCEPQSDQTDRPFPTTTIVPPTTMCAGPTDFDATPTTTNPLPCEETWTESDNVSASTIAGLPVAITTVPCTASDCRLLYEIQTGDYPRSVADAFCVTIDELVAANGWTDGEFGFPREVNQIPPSSTPCPTNQTAIPTTTTTSP